MYLSVAHVREHKIELDNLYIAQGQTHELHRINFDRYKTMLVQGNLTITCPIELLLPCPSTGRPFIYVAFTFCAV